MLTQICQYLRNWFARDILVGDFTISNNTVTYADGTALSLVTNQYFRIVGSLFNDGVHKLDNKLALTDETFTGAVWSMAVPPVVVDLASEIAAWITANEGAINSPYASESFGGYSYSLKSGSGTNGENRGATWENQFADRLSPWRKI